MLINLKDIPVFTTLNILHHFCSYKAETCMYNAYGRDCIAGNSNLFEHI